MAVRNWRGSAPKIVKIVTCTVGGTIEAGDLFTVTCGSKSVTVAAPSTIANATAEAIATAVALLCASSLYPEFQEFACAYVAATATFTLTGVTAGVDFFVVLTTTETGGGAADAQTFTQTDTVAGSGPNWWSVAANWLEGSVPGNGDDAVLDGSVDILWGLAQSAVTLASLTAAATWKGNVGLPPINAGASGSGAVPTAEYRPQELAIGATLVTINGSGGRMRLNTGSVQTSINVLGTGRPALDGVKTLLWCGTSVANEASIAKGSFASGNYGEAYTLNVLRVSFDTNKDSDADVRLGSAGTLGNIEKSGGLLEINSSFNLLDSQGGTTVINAGTQASIRIFGSKVLHRTSGTCTQGEIGSGGELDKRQDIRGATITNLTVHRGATIQDPLGAFTFTNPIQRTAAIADMKLDLGGLFEMAAM